MECRQLGQTDIKVSAICLGTMTWGEQNSEQDAHAQLDMALDHGINFVDTAEMYPVPPKGETQGLTEQYIGTWFTKTGKRHDIILASKVVGRSSGHPSGFTYMREGEICLDRRNIEAALDASLTRLQTDYIDLYQLHWPDRSTNMFGQLGYTHNANEDFIALQKTLTVLDDCIKAGKIRYVGISNETPWGMMECIRISESADLPRIMSIQNPYNLLNRSFEVGLAEIAIREQCGLLAYSPLAFGVLSGKYLQGQQPDGARLTLFERFQRYQGVKAETATARYVALAREHGLDPAQMALAYVTSRPFTTSNIIGATSLSQLESNINSVAISLSAEILEGIEAIHNDIPNPCP